MQESFLTQDVKLDLHFFGQINFEFQYILDEKYPVLAKNGQAY